MARKFLVKVSLAAGFPVESEDGWLRLPTHERPCLGYSCGCVCPSCGARVQGKSATPICECPAPMISEASCFRCGREVSAAA
jgi:hypothetical protein